MELTPFWRADAPRPDDLVTTNELPPETDVLVVGAGFTGLHAAREIARGGRLSTVIIDAEGVEGVPPR